MLRTLQILSSVTVPIGLLSLVAGCATTGQPTTGGDTDSGTEADRAERLDPIRAEAERRGDTCPLSGRTLGERPANRRFSGQIILFHSEAEAALFDELPGGEKRLVAGRQHLARRGVVNQQCLVSGLDLPIDARLVAIDGLTFAFATDQALEAFAAMPERSRAELVGPYLVLADGLANSRCPVTENPLKVGCPTVTVSGVVIGFDDESARTAYQGMNSVERSELTAALVLPRRGISNTSCPETGLPLLLDSPVFEFEGVLIGVRNVAAARAFNERMGAQAPSTNRTSNEGTRR